MGFGFGTRIAVGRRAVSSQSSAPSGISLTAPTIYLSGLSFEDQDPWSNGSIQNPYNLTSLGVWESVSSVGFVLHIGGEWQVYVAATIDGGVASVLVATNTAPSTSLPTTGWVNTNANLIVSGTLVISTTP